MYWEPAKWVAKLRALKTEPTFLVFDINMNVGHFGALGRYGYLKDEVAKEYAFLLYVFGIEANDVNQQGNQIIGTPKGFMVWCWQMIQLIFHKIK